MKFEEKHVKIKSQINTMQYHNLHVYVYGSGTSMAVDELKQ